MEDAAIQIDTQGPSIHHNNCKMLCIVPLNNANKHLLPLRPSLICVEHRKFLKNEMSLFHGS